MGKPVASWFAVDKAGMALVLERRGIAYALFELYQNADDTGATRIEMELTPVAGRTRAPRRDNDPDGFVDLGAPHPLRGAPRRPARPRAAATTSAKLVLCRCSKRRSGRRPGP